MQQEHLVQESGFNRGEKVLFSLVMLFIVAAVLWVILPSGAPQPERSWASDQSAGYAPRAIERPGEFAPAGSTVSAPAGAGY